MCKVNGCNKCFARGEHLKRHVRSIHTNEKREWPADLHWLFGTGFWYTLALSQPTSALSLVVGRTLAGTTISDNICACTKTTNRQRTIPLVPLEFFHHVSIAFFSSFVLFISSCPTSAGLYHISRPSWQQTRNLFGFLCAIFLALCIPKHQGLSWSLFPLNPLLLFLY